MIVTVRLPQARAAAVLGIQRSIMLPLIAEPTSAATAAPYPGTKTRVPSGITAGSTAITPTPTASPLAVLPGR